MSEQMLLLFVLVSMAAGGLRAAQSPCDPNLLQPPANPYGYRLRGDRCEGIYIQEVGGAPLTALSWTETFDDFDSSTGHPLLLAWTSPSRVNVRLRAQSLRRRLYYRMDAIPSHENAFQWKPDLLAALSIPKPELGVIASYRGSAGGAEHEIFLPLRIGQEDAVRKGAAYRLVVVPGVELKEVYVTLFAEGAGAHPILNGEALGYGYYPPERAVEISIPAPPKTGVYRLEIGATLRAGGAATAELWFYHPRR